MQIQVAFVRRLTHTCAHAYTRLCMGTHSPVLSAATFPDAQLPLQPQMAVWGQPLQSQKELTGPLQGWITDSRAQQGLQQGRLPERPRTAPGQPRGRLQTGPLSMIGSLHHAGSLGWPPHHPTPTPVLTQRARLLKMAQTGLRVRNCSAPACQISGAASPDPEGWEMGAGMGKPDLARSPMGAAIAQASLPGEGSQKPPDSYPSILSYLRTVYNLSNYTGAGRDKRSRECYTAQRTEEEKSITQNRLKLVQEH